MLVLAPGKSPRLVIDFRALNEKTVGDRYPLPNIESLPERVGNAQVFSVMDFSSSFYQIPLREYDQFKMGFSTHNGHFEFTRSHMGLKTSLNNFQRVVDIALQGLLGKICTVFIDDLLIFSRNMKEHLEHLKIILERLEQAGLKVKPGKCQFVKK